LPLTQSSQGEKSCKFNSQSKHWSLCTLTH
jgi:hypothetical protein